MKKTLKLLVLVLAISLMFSVSAFADDSSARLNYVTDEAELLSYEQVSALNSAAAEISKEYGCSVYIITLNDYKNYSNGSVYDCATGIFDSYELGWGSDKSGVLLLLSMQERDYSLIAHGDTGNAAFTDYGKDLLSEEFLDNFSKNDWYGGFSDYLSTVEYMLSKEAAGAPVDVQGASGYQNRNSPFNILLIVLLPCVIAFAVCSVFKAQMKTAKLKTNAHDYVGNSGIDLRIRQDQFINRTETRQVIQQTRSTGGGRGGTTIRSGGFSGKSGKF